MSIRVTQTMLNKNMMRNLSNSMGAMDKLQEQASSGRVISRPSDDPVIASRGMYYRTALAENEQFQRNMNEAQAWMDTTDQALDEAVNLMHRAKELLVQSGGVLDDAARQAIAGELSQIREQMGSVANKTIGGRYIFAGTETKTQPFDPVTQTFTNQSADDINVELSKGIFLPINVQGVQVFNEPATDNIFKVLGDAVTILNTGASATSVLDRVVSQTDNMLAVRATLGARVNRLELISERLSTEEVSLNKLMSDNEDADMAEVITELKTQENVHRSALGVGARIIQPSLLDFLR
ncbi:flagellar hook-associated protein FlgL [Brevibacillus dissolubilis]|uniref:flagellar hook-associated protein FlgL n=1 Tax=Brevibacillus dissolubilis TaxID=1844116 RepID=UPI001115D0D8|nr:flagellar hook-associated protein FlgL [Brevibacillus dissolubilis]